MTRQKVIAGGTLALLPALALLGGCAPMNLYLISQGFGQIAMLLGSAAIDEVLAGGRLEPEQQRKLQLVVEAREFARQQLGLHVGGSFSLFHETGGEPIGYNLSAARQDALIPKRWEFPIVGPIDYLGFFARPDAENAAAELEKEGHDTYIYSVDTYSTLGWFPDPVQSTFLKRSDGSLVETVIHELAHNTVYAPGQSNFNESLATYVGRLGARLFFEQRGQAGREIVAALEKSYADNERITAWMTSFETVLREYYAQDISTEEKLAGREAIFQAARDRFTVEVLPELSEPQRHRGWADLPTNNAFVLLHRRYHLDLDLFAGLYERCAGDFAALLDVLRAAAGAADPFAHLRQAAGSP